MVKALYKPLSILLGVLGGVLAGKVFEQAWKRIDPQEQAPDPDRRDAGWTKVLLAAALHGVVYAVVKAAVARGGAKAVEKTTGTWPGKTDAKAT